MPQAFERTQEQNSPSPVTAQTILERLDTMLAELQALRQEVQTIVQTGNEPQKQPCSLADELHGSLGQGSPEELNYDIDINLYRFCDEPLNTEKLS